MSMLESATWQMVESFRKEKNVAKLTAEHRAKIGAANSGRPLSPEHRAKISAALTGRTLASETRAKIRRSSRKMWARYKRLAAEAEERTT